MLGAQVAKGRPRKPNVRRDLSGKSRGEPEVIDASVLFYRKRDLLKDRVRLEHAKDALAGSSLGRLLLRYRTNPQDPGAISQEQYDAGVKWIAIIHRHAQVMGYSLGSPRSPSFIMVGRGLSCATEATDEEIASARDRFRICYDALAAASRDHGRAVQYVTWAICIENRPIGSMEMVDYGALRVGLNALARVLR